MSDNVSLLLPKDQRPVLSADLAEVGHEIDELVDIPLLGFVTAGQPIEAVEQQESISVPRNMVRRNTYALKVRGHSMIEDNIQDGDVIIIEKRESAQNGQSVVCLINGEDVTLKKFYVEKDGIRLQPANKTMDPIFLRNDEVQILGIVSGVIRQYD